jgi:hypothetical protein
MLGYYLLNSSSHSIRLSAVPVISYCYSLTVTSAVMANEPEDFGAAFVEELDGMSDGAADAGAGPGAGAGAGAGGGAAWAPIGAPSTNVAPPASGDAYAGGEPAAAPPIVMRGRVAPSTEADAGNVSKQLLVWTGEWMMSEQDLVRRRPQRSSARASCRADGGLFLLRTARTIPRLSRCSPPSVRPHPPPGATTR